MKPLFVKIFAYVFLWTAQTLSQTYIDSLTQAFENRSGKERISASLELSRRLRRNSPEQSLQYAKTAVALADTLNLDLDKVIGLRYSGIVHRQRAEYLLALDHFQQSLDISHKMDDQSNVAFTLSDIGFVYKAMGDLDKALEHHLQSLQIREVLDDKHNIAYSLNNIGTIYKEIGDFDKALEYHEKSIELREVIGDSTGLAYSLNKIGSVYTAMGKSAEALDSYLQALTLREQAGNPHLVAHSLSNVGKTYKDLKKYDMALVYNEKALSLFQEMQNKKGQALTYEHIGDVYQELGETNKALSLYTKSLEAERAINDRVGICDKLNKIAQFHDHMGQWKTAEYKYKNSLELAQKIQSKIMIQIASHALSELYAKHGLYQKAYEYHILSTDATAELIDETSNSKIRQLHTRYEVEKREKEIEVLKKNRALQELEMVRHKWTRNFFITAFLLILIIGGFLFIQYKIKRAAAAALQSVNERQAKLLDELKIINAQKDRFFSIIAHDLKDSLQVQLSGARLLSIDIEDLSKEKIEVIGSELKTNTEKLYSLLENLLQWSRMQMGRIDYNPTSVDMNSLCAHCIDLNIDRANKKGIKIISNLEGAITVYADHAMLQSILMNCLSNAVKFCCKDDEIIISAKVDDSKIEIKIADTGIGIEKSQLENLFKLDYHQTTLGTAEEKGTGLGLILCKDFAEKNRGKIWLESEQGEGTTVHILLPTAQTTDNDIF